MQPGCAAHAAQHAAALVTLGSLAMSGGDEPSSPGKRPDAPQVGAAANAPSPDAAAAANAPSSAAAAARSSASLASSAAFC